MTAPSVGPSPGRIAFSRGELLSFYDDPSCNPFAGSSATHLGASPGSHVSALTGLLGEDLVLALLVDYLRDPMGRQAPRPGVRIASFRCIQAPADGKRKLDAWLVHESHGIQEAFQVEVKNWSSYSLGEARSAVKLDDSWPMVVETAQKRWSRFVASQFQAVSVTKVASEFELPKFVQRTAQRIRVLAFWLPISPDQQAIEDVAPLNWVNIAGKECLVFSASLYLRQRTDSTIYLEVPRVADRLLALQRLIPGLGLAPP
jgi:hypothetical protein